MTSDQLGFYELCLIILANIGDTLIDSTPLIILCAGALALSIGVIAWPLEPSRKKDGGGHGFV